MQTYQTLAELTASRQSKTGTLITCRENFGFYIVQDSGYTPTGSDITVANGRVVKFEFAFSALNIKTTGGNVQGDLDSIISGGLPTQSGNKDRVLTTDGTSASWTTVGLEFATTAEMQAVSPTVDGIVAYNQQRANAKYILSTTATAQPGDITAANGNVWVLQIQDRANVKWFGAVGDGVTDDTSAIQDAFDRMDGATVYDQQFYGGVVYIPRGSYLFTSQLLWDRHHIEGDGSFCSVLLWDGGNATAISKTQANTWAKGLRMQVVGGGTDTADFPNYWIDNTSTKVDWAFHLYDVYFGKCLLASTRCGQPVNHYFERVRWDNAGCLLEVNGEGTGSNNRIVSLKDCTVDFTQLSGVNTHVDCLFRFNMGNSDYYTLVIENWRFEGVNDEFSGDAIIQLNDLNSPTQELRSRPLNVVFRNVGMSIDNATAKVLDLIEVNTARTGVINIPVTFDNFYQNGQITNLFTSGSSAALSSLQDNPVLPLTMGYWAMWPVVGGASDIPQKLGRQFDFNGMTVESDGDNMHAPSILDGDPDAETDIKTISSGVIDVTGKTGLVTVDTEAGAATDDLDTITGGVGNQRIILRSVNNARDVVVKDGTGNIQMDNTGADVTLGTRGQTVELIYSSQIGAWLEI